MWSIYVLQHDTTREVYIGKTNNLARRLDEKVCCLETKKWCWTQRKSLWRLFTKNTAPCELVRGGIGGDA